jgi:hypothetical protein
LNEQTRRPHCRREDDFEPLLVPHPRAQKLLNIGHTKYWELVKAGEVEVIDVGKRSMAKYRSLKRLAGV